MKHFILAVASIFGMAGEMDAADFGNGALPLELGSLPPPPPPPSDPVALPLGQLQARDMADPGHWECRNGVCVWVSHVAQTPANAKPYAPAAQIVRTMQAGEVCIDCANGVSTSGVGFTASSDGDTSVRVGLFSGRFFSGWRSWRAERRAARATSGLFRGFGGCGG